MKADYIVLGLAGLAVWFIVKGQGTGQSAFNLAANQMAAGLANASNDPAKLIQSYQGWQYFTDGTSISPEGSYFHNGVLVWSPAS